MKIELKSYTDAFPLIGKRVTVVHDNDDGTRLATVATVTGCGIGYESSLDPGSEWVCMRSDEDHTVVFALGTCNGTPRTLDLEGTPCESCAGSGSEILIGPYDDVFKEALKSTIPPDDREWLPVAKAWKFREAYRSEIEALIGRFT